MKTPIISGLVSETSDLRASVDADTRFLRVTDLATDGERRRALWLCLLIGLISLACIPVAPQMRPHFQDLLIAYQSGLIAAFLISSYLLYALFRGSRSTALLFLSGGCLYTGATLGLQLASYPGVLAADGLFPGGPQATIRFWISWHAVLPAAISLYAIGIWRKPAWISHHPERSAARAGAAWLTLLGAGLVLLTVHGDLLPPLQSGAQELAELATHWLGPALLANIAIAMLLLWRATRLRSVLHAWLGVALMALLFDTIITMIGASRFSVGWYVGQGNALICAAVMLLVCMGEINRAYVRTVNSVRRLATANALLEAKVDQAGLDHLTGLPGRALFMQRVRALRTRNFGKGMVVALMLVDLDGFKRVNDTYGHERGDQVLKGAADVLRSVLRDTDVAARFGGDEFVVCLFAPFSVVQTVMIQIAGRIVSGMAQLDQSINCGFGCSVGVTLYGADRLNLELAMQQADEAMYLAKSQGKNRYVIHGQPLATAPLCLTA
jgi:diguanylate cyclase (GGDEF)-like protein